MERLIVTSVSQASAIQRAGRAGRTRPGKCFRMYTESAYNALHPSTIPEISRTNLAFPLLQLKAIGIDNIIKFDFLAPPPIQALTEALELLYSLNAIDDSAQLKEPFGKLLSEFPLEPMLATILLNSSKFKCTEEALTICAMLSVQNVFYLPEKKRTEAITAHRQFYVQEGDIITYINIYMSFIKSRMSAKWCSNNFLNYKSLSRAVTIREHLSKHMRRIGITYFESCKTDTGTFS
jgi:ATP-dependent RNA helicase DDX35